ncbi:MAG: hypothetical protein ACPGSD_04425 [Flavobacteriales bacterium]
MKKYDLSIPQYWKINKHEFYDINLETYFSIPFEERNHFVLLEDIAQFSCKTSDGNLTMDLGWYPEENKDGAYTLLLIKDFDWDKPVEKFQTRNGNEIAKTIQVWFEKYNNL